MTNLLFTYFNVFYKTICLSHTERESPQEPEYIRLSTDK